MTAHNEVIRYARTEARDPIARLEALAVLLRRNGETREAQSLDLIVQALKIWLAS